MKIFTLSAAMLLLSAMAYSQTNPCPNIVLYSYGVISTSGLNCTSTVKVTANGIGVGSQKGMIVDVYKNTVSPANLLVSNCFIVQGGSVNGIYETSQFTVGCSTPIVYVITRTTSSNGLCNGGTCSGSTIITVDGGTLPIKISSFYVKRNGNAVSLTWTSETEINAKEYVIERNSGSGFVAVGTVAATNNGGGSSYSYVDNNNSKAVSQYRLKLVDKDASYKQSEIRTVKGTAAVSDFTVYPNPSMGHAKISITDISEATNVEVIDNAGRVVRSIELKTSSSVEVNNLQSGIYLVRITNKATGDALTKKLTVSN
jgi:hypothetical protein